MSRTSTLPLVSALRLFLHGTVFPSSTVRQCPQPGEADIGSLDCLGTHGESEGRVMAPQGLPR
jgi:hypothetical protein